MRFLLDQNLPRSLEALFAAHGHEALHVKSLNLAGASDRLIWDTAVKLGAAVVSKDSDFLPLATAGGGALLWLRIGNCSNAALSGILERALPLVEERFSRGGWVVEVRR